MMHRIDTIGHKVRNVLASKWFFVGVIVLFVFQAVWIALSARYPMAFDEDFHLGIIKIYATQWSPFLHSTPAGSASFGAVIADPSYLFHYVMSFPYRVFNDLWHNQIVTVILLRLIDVAMVAYALVVFRRVILRAGIGRAATHTLLGLFVQIPIFALMAGQINYDDLLLVGVAWLCLLTQTIMADIRRHQLRIAPLVLFISVGGLSSIVKYAFLPIVVAAVVFLVLYGFYCFPRKNRAHALIIQLKQSFHMMTKPLLIGLTILLVVSVGLFSQRYISNVVNYHAVIPSCDAVLDTNTCLAYGPFNRDHGLNQDKLSAAKASSVSKTEKIKKALVSPFEYFAIWLYGMWYRLFFMINGNFGVNRYQNFPPLPIIGTAAVLIALAGFIAIARYARLIFRSPIHVFFASIIGLYCAALLWQNYGAYRHTGQAVAVNGRYLLPILLPLGVLMLVGLSRMIRSTSIRSGLAVVSLIIFFSGNSLISFIVRSDPNWYWKDDTVKSVNLAAQRVVDPLIWYQSTHHKLPQP